MEQHYFFKSVKVLCSNHLWTLGFQLRLGILFITPEERCPPQGTCNSLPERKKVWIPYHWYMQLSISLPGCKKPLVSAAPGIPCPLFVGSAQTQGRPSVDALITQLGPALPGRHPSTWARTALLCRAPSAPAGPALGFSTPGSALRCAPSPTPSAPCPGLAYLPEPEMTPHSWGPPPWGLAYRAQH